MMRLKVLDLLDAVKLYEKKFNLALSYSGLRYPQFKALNFLEKSGKITVSDLSRYLNVTRATISVLINDLIKARLVESIDNRMDKRSYYIRLTQRGMDRLNIAKTDILLVEEKISNYLSSDLIQCLNDFSKIIRE